MDIGDWLRTLGLDQYEAIFRQNDIDTELLPTLGADDLRELGITSLGHRKRLLAAIAALADRPSVAATSENLHHESPTGSASTSAERRQLTVMFCDLVGSTAGGSAGAFVFMWAGEPLVIRSESDLQEAMRRIGLTAASDRRRSADLLGHDEIVAIRQGARRRFLERIAEPPRAARGKAEGLDRKWE